jgi:hypothetical protein
MTPSSPVPQSFCNVPTAYLDAINMKFLADRGGRSLWSRLSVIRWEEQKDNEGGPHVMWTPRFPSSSHPFVLNSLKVYLMVAGFYDDGGT